MYISIDLDDTLLNKKKELSEYNLTVLKKCQELGHKIIINTARNHYLAKTIIDKIDFDYFVLNAGSQILNFKKEQIITYPIDNLILDDLVNDLKQYSSVVSLQDDMILYSTEENPKRPDIVTYDFSNGYPHPCYKILVKTVEQEAIKKIAAKYNLDFVNYLNGLFCRINNINATKWKAIENIIAYDLGNFEVISFGDDYGDLEMLEKSTVGVAMANSVPYVLDKIKVHAKSNDEDGVGKFLVNYFKLNIWGE